MDSTFSTSVAHLWGVVDASDDSSNKADQSTTTDRLTVNGPRGTLGSAFDVTALATGSVAVATQAAAAMWGSRHEASAPPVTVDSREASAAFKSEAFFTPEGWELPPLWDPVAGNYLTADGWIRLHTNYASHRAAVQSVLGADDRESIAEILMRRDGEEVEASVVEAGGAAAVMHTRDEWLDSAPGAATADAAAISVSTRSATGTPSWFRTANDLPFSGIRVLDLTRVIAGPVCTKFLAAYGAEVLRIDPPGFEEVFSLLPESTLGKRVAALDLTTGNDRQVFDGLVASADVLVCGLRGDALDGLGYNDRRLIELNPDLIIAVFDAYGWNGPWATRRGFDSLVQMSCGIAATAASGGPATTPNPLPVQALDHGTGWLLGAAVARALHRRLTESRTSTIHASLVSTANLLYSLSEIGSHDQTMTSLDDLSLDRVSTGWGPGRRLPFPGRIDGLAARFSVDAGPLGRHAPAWS